MKIYFLRSHKKRGNFRWKLPLEIDSSDLRELAAWSLRGGAPRGAWAFFITLTTTMWWAGSCTMIMATKTVEKLFSRDVTAFVGIKTAKNRIANHVREAINTRNSGVFFLADKAVFPCNFVKFFKAALIDAVTESFTGALDLVAAYFTITIGVYAVAAFFTHLGPEVTNGLTLFFVNFTIFVVIEVLKKLRESAVTN
jgi:hypothetical protein